MNGNGELVLSERLHVHNSQIVTLGEWEIWQKTTKFILPCCEDGMQPISFRSCHGCLTLTCRHDQTRGSRFIVENVWRRRQHLTINPQAGKMLIFSKLCIWGEHTLKLSHKGKGRRLEVTEGVGVNCENIGEGCTDEAGIVTTGR